MNQKKVLIITYYWPPSGGPGVQRWLKFVKYLPSFGIQPVVLTVDPANAEYPIIDKSLESEISPDLKVYRTKSKGVYDWYKKITGSKTAPYSGFANEGNPSILQKTARFIRGNFFLPDARRGWIKYAFAEACRLIEQGGIDTIITTGPPHSTHLTGLKLKRKYQVKWIADFRDPWTTIYYNNALRQTRWAKKIDRRYEQSVLDSCDYLLLVADDRANLAVDPNKVIFVPNGYDTGDFQGKQPEHPPLFTLSYTGTIANNYPTAKLLETFGLLRQQITFKLRFVGKISEKIRKDFSDNLDESVEFVDFVSHDEAINYMMSSYILLLLIPDADNNKHILTGKVFEYLATGKPVLVVGPSDSVAAQFVRQANVGSAFDYNDVEGIYAFLLQQYQLYLEGKYPAADLCFIEGFSRKALTEKIALLIR